MRLLLIGLLVGGLAGFAVQKFVLEDDSATPRRGREVGTGGGRNLPARKDDGSVDVEALLQRIRDLQGQLAARGDGAEEALAKFGDIKIPETDEEIDALFEEFDRTNDLDRLIALIESLLRKGPSAYPRLTRVIERFIGKVAARTWNEENEFLPRVVPAFKMVLRHEKKLVGYVGYLLTDENVPAMLRTGAMGAAMFLSVNRVPGAESFGPELLKAFTAGAGGGLFGGGGEQTRMLIEAMGLLKEKSAVDGLLAMLKDPSQKKMHYRAIKALGRIGDERAVGPLLAQLRAKPGEAGRGEIGALAAIGTQEAVAAAEGHLRGLEDDDSFFNAAGSFLRERSSDGVIQMVRDRFKANPNSYNLWGVMRGLARANTPSSHEALREIASTAKQDWVRQMAQRTVKEQEKLKAAASGGLDK